MPPDNVNGLSAETYASIVAFVLKANGAQAGSSALTADTNVPIASIANGRSRRVTRNASRSAAMWSTRTVERR